MKKKVSSLTIRVPHELKEKIVQAADQQGISINQYAMYIFTKEVTRLEVSQETEWKQIKEQYIGTKTEDEIKKNFKEVMKKVKSSNKVPDWDRI
jgi:antitoxin component of RelBE/YafQ-DinJ toxin-antitoxin module